MDLGTLIKRREIPCFGEITEWNKGSKQDAMDFLEKD